MKQNLANSIILPLKNGGLKAWSHSVRKANSCIYLPLAVLSVHVFPRYPSAHWQVNVKFSKLGEHIPRFLHGFFWQGSAKNILTCYCKNV